MLCISMILCGNMDMKAEAREPYYYYGDIHLINLNMQRVDEVVIHEGESILFSRGDLQDDGSYLYDETWYTYYPDWHITVIDSEGYFEDFYEDEKVKVWQPKLSSNVHVYVKGLKATNADDNYYLEFSTGTTMMRIPITVLPAEAGVTYPTYPEAPTDIFYTLDDAYEYIRQMTRNRVQETYYLYMPEELKEDYEGFEGAYGFYTSQAELKPDEGDYMDLSGFGSYGTSSTGSETYRRVRYAEIEVRRAGYIYNTTVEQERAVDAKIASLFGAGGALEYTKNLQPHEQVKACMDYINATVTYIGTTDSIPHSAYGALINGQATCQGYAMAFYRLLRELGIPNRIVMVEDVGAHTFNLVLLNGKYYYCDVGSNVLLKGSNSFGHAPLQSMWRDDARFVENIWNKVSATDYDPSAVIYATALDLDIDTVYKSALGESFQITATVTPANAINAEVVWSTSDPTVVTVDATGRVTVTGEGMAGIIAKTSDGRLAEVGIVVVDLPDSGDDTTNVEPTEQELQVQSFVERVYNITLGRSADAEGMEFWTTKLINWELDGAQLIRDFVGSTEFTNKGLSDEEYIDTLYQAVLNREADEEGKAYWVSAFGQGATREMLMEGFVASEEFDALCDGYGILAIIKSEDLVGKFVERMYTVVLNREADEAGKASWVDKLLSGKVDGATLGSGFVNSSEFVGRNLYDSQYITVLYQALFDREPDVGGMATWLKHLALGATRQDVLNGLATSAEFDALCTEYGIIAVITQEMRVEGFVERMYTIFLNRAAEEEGMQFYKAALLNQEINGCQVVNTFVSSSEFNGRGLTDSEYIDTLYLGILDREADEDGKAYWLNEFANGSDRRQLMLEFLYSEEFGTLCSEYGITRGSL